MKFIKLLVICVLLLLLGGCTNSKPDYDFEKEIWVIPFAQKNLEQQYILKQLNKPMTEDELNRSFK